MSDKRFNSTGDGVDWAICVAGRLSIAAKGRMQLCIAVWSPTAEAWLTVCGAVMRNGDAYVTAQQAHSRRSAGILYELCPHCLQRVRPDIAAQVRLEA